MQVDVNMKSYFIYAVIILGLVFSIDAVKAQEATPTVTPEPTIKILTTAEHIIINLRGNCVPMSDRCNVVVLKDFLKGLEKDVEKFWEKRNAETTPVPTVSP